MTGHAAGALRALVYVSEAVVPFDDDDLAALLSRSRHANELRSITGILLYRAPRFVQFLEGPAAEIDELMTSIRADPRHHGVRVLLEEDTSQRRFSDWTMGYQTLREPTTPAPEGFRSTFDDLDDARDPSAVVRAAQELSLWFRVRTASDAPRAW